MNLRLFTLLAALFIAADVVGGIIGYVEYITQARWQDSPRLFITWPIGLLSRVFLSLFLFTLFLRQKGGA